MEGKVFRYGEYGDPLIYPKEGSRITVLRRYLKKPELKEIIEYWVSGHGSKVDFGVRCSAETKGLHEIVESAYLLQRGDIEGWEIAELQFQGKKIMRFASEDDALAFAYNFANDYLIPKYGREEAVKFPMAKSEHLKNGNGALARMLSAEQSPNKETWLAVPAVRFDDIHKYINSMIVEMEYQKIRAGSQELKNTGAQQPL